MKSFLLASLLFISNNIYGQLGNHFYGGTGDDFLYELVPSHDGNFYAVGSKSEGLQKIWLVKLSPDLNILWEKTYSFSDPTQHEHGYSVNVLPDGSMIITGEQVEEASFPDRIGLALKLDSNGTPLWKKLYNDASTLYDAQVVENKIMMVGWYDNTGSSNSGILMITDLAGVKISKTEIKVANQNFVKRILPTPDGNILLAGRANVIGVGYQGIFLRKIMVDGTEIWTRYYDTGFSEDLASPDNDIIPKPLGVLIQDDGTIWVTNPKEYNADISLLAFSSDGDFISEKIYGDPQVREFPDGLIQLENNAFLIAGSTLDGRAFAMKINDKGLEEWREYYYSHNTITKSYGVEKINDHYVLCGRFQDDVSGSSDDNGWLFLIEEDGNHFPYTVSGRVFLDKNVNCLFEVGEKPLSGWFLDVKGSSNPDTLITNDKGYFEFKTDEGSNQFTLFNKNGSQWTICNNDLMVLSNSLHPVDSILFPIQTKTDCPLLEISLTQPDLIRCDTSCLNVTVLNSGSEESQELLVTIEMDHELSILSSSEPYTIFNEEIRIELNSIPALSDKNIDICVLLDCNVQLGATHKMMGNVIPICTEPYAGPWFHVDGRCENNSVRFFLWNSGGGGQSASSEYTVFADGILLAENININLPENGLSKILDFPADGRTWRVEAKQNENVPVPGHPSITVEACGKGNNGLHSIGFQNGWRSNDLSQANCILQVPNTIGVPNKVSEAISGLGQYNIMNDTGKLEFTARVNNTTGKIVSEVIFDLILSPAIDPRTFQLLSAPGVTIVSYPQHNQMRVTIKQLMIFPDDNVMIRFGLNPRTGVVPDEAANSIFLVEANAYMDGKGPIALVEGFENYSLTVPVREDIYNQYPDDYKLFGGKNYEFAISMAKGLDQSIFIGGESNSYGARNNMDGYVIKTDHEGKAEWLMALDAGTQKFNTVRGIAPLADGGCIVTGNFLPVEQDENLLTHRIYIARLSSDGKILWIKTIHTLFQDQGGWIYGIIPTPDNNFVIFGYAENGSIDQLYQKIDEDGNVIWTHHTEITGSAFIPIQGVALADGSCVFLGTNESTSISNDVYIEKISSDGEIIWSTGYDSSYGIYLGDIASAADGGFMVTGFSQWQPPTGDYAHTPTFIKFNAEGIFEWEKNPVVGPFRFADASCITNSPAGGFLAGGSILIDTSDHWTDMFLMKIDENADVEWWHNYGVKNDEVVKDIIAFSPDEIFLWSYNQPRPPFYNLQGILIKTNGLGELTSISSNAIEYSKAGTFIFPNPTSSSFNIILSPEPIYSIEWSIVDITGRIVKFGKAAPAPAIEIETADLQSGTYFITFPGTMYPGKQLVVIQ